MRVRAGGGPAGTLMCLITSLAPGLCVAANSSLRQSVFTKTEKPLIHYESVGENIVYIYIASLFRIMTYIFFFHSKHLRLLPVELLPIPLFYLKHCASKKQHFLLTASMSCDQKPSLIVTTALDK